VHQPAKKRYIDPSDRNVSFSELKSSDPIPEPGQLVAVRQRLYLVEQSVPPVNPGDSMLVRLSCVDDDAQGQTLDILWDISRMPAHTHRTAGTASALVNLTIRRFLPHI